MRGRADGKPGIAKGRAYYDRDKTINPNIVPSIAEKRKPGRPRGSKSGPRGFSGRLRGRARRARGRRGRGRTPRYSYRNLARFDYDQQYETPS